eukprot:CAMPEP_0185042028 /NCGR_PEP_ID=MMETSP1103-20130426/42050_1 /TAXON_ID=36769 /ORGANISM="Paraphysomonas bandaiensis, Strain Caron Lab Isolate" /LENGTH=1155 /DNA_ID=CAMNT_0027582013 /DNA_START=42 /DNA_END=3509 /DNA_ORIENTATION=+
MVKGYSKKQKPETSNKHYMYAPPMRPQNTDSHDSLILRRLEEMTRRIDLMQNAQTLSSTSQVLQQAPQVPNRPSNQASTVNISPRTSNLIDNYSPLKKADNNAMSNNGSDFKLSIAGDSSRQQEIDELTHMVHNLQMSLRESQDEYVRAVMRTESETKERQLLEKRNAELNSKLMEARQALKETQAALQSVQLATEQLSNKREQREQHIMHLSNENTAYVSKIATLEAKLKDAEDAVMESNSRRDEFVHRLQDQLSQCQDEIFQAQADGTAINGEKVQLEAELDAVRQKLATTEQKLKSAENAVDISFKTKLQNLEEKNRALSEKLQDEKQLQSKIEYLEDQLKAKSKSLQQSSQNMKTLENSLHECQIRLRATESKLHDAANDYQELEFKLRNAERENQTDRHLQAKISLLEDEISEKDATLKQLHQRNYELETHLDAAEAKITNIDAALLDKSDALQEMEFKIRALERTKNIEKNSDSRIAALDKELTEKNAIILQHSATLKKLENALDEATTRCKSSETLLHERTQRLQELDVKLKAAERENAADKIVISRIEGLESELSEKSHQLNMEIQTTKSLQAQLEESNLRVRSLEESIQGKKEQMQDVEMRLKNAELESLSDKQMISRIHILQDQLAEKTSALQIKTEKLKALEVSAQDNAMKVRTLESTVKEKNSQIQDIEFKMKTCERDLSSSRSEISSTKNKLAAMEGQYSQLDARMKAVVIEKHELSSKLAVLEQLVENAAELALELDASEEAKNKLESELETANQRLKTLTAEYDKCALDLQTAENRVFHSQQEIRDLQGRMAEMVPAGSSNSSLDLNSDKFSTLSSRIAKSHTPEKSSDTRPTPEPVSRTGADTLSPLPGVLFDIREEASADMDDLQGSSDNVDNSRPVLDRKRSSRRLKKSSSTESDGGRIEDTSPQARRGKSSRSLQAQDSAEYDRSQDEYAADRPKIKREKSSKSMKRMGSAEKNGTPDTDRPKVIKKKSSKSLTRTASTESEGAYGELSGSESGDEGTNATEGMDEQSWSLLRGMGVTGNKHTNKRRSSLAVLVDFMGTTRREVEKLKAEKNSLKKQITEWQNKFAEENGRPPSKAEKESQASELYTQYQRVSTNLKKKESKLKKSEKTFTIKKEVMPAILEKEKNQGLAAAKASN